MDVKAVYLALAVTAAASACKHMEYKSISGKPNHTLGTVITWAPDRMAAVIIPDREGNRDRACMQAALAIKEIDADASIKVADSILQYTKVLDAMKAKATGQEMASLTGNMNQTVVMLSTTSERTSFLSAGLFYACQIAANQDLDDEATSTLTKAVIEAAAGLRPVTMPATETKQIPPPTPKQ